MNTNFNEELSKAYNKIYDISKCCDYLKNCLKFKENNITKENIEKLKILSNKNNILINILISQLYFKIINDENSFDKITNESNLLISLCNGIIKLINSFQELIISDEIYLLKKQTIKLIKFIYINYKSNLNKDELENLKYLINELQQKFFSENYQKFIISHNKILNENINFEINLINDILSETFCLNEQFEIINSIFDYNYLENEKIKDVDSIIQYGKLLIKFIYSEKIKLIINDENMNEDNNSFLLLDAVNNFSNKIQSKSNENIQTNFLNNKKFSLYQYNKSKNIINIIHSFIQYIHQNNNIFQNNYNKELIYITNYLSNILININNSEYYKEINLNNFTLEIGIKNKINIPSGESKYININTNDNNSIIYIEFDIKDNINNNIDITFNLYKYQKIEKTIDEKDKKISYYNFQLLYNLTNINKQTKIILFSQEPSLYKIEFDNHYSWMKGKEILYRVLILKCLENEIIIPENNIKFDSNIYCYFEGKNQTFYFNEIDNDIKEKKMQKENNEIVISVLIYLNIIRIINTKEEKLNFLEFKDENKDNILTNFFFEKKIFNYIQSLNLKNNEKIILNIFSLNHNLSSNNEKIEEMINALSTETINNTKNKKVINSIEKIGIFPNFKRKIPNLIYNIFNLSDLFLIYFLYKSIEKKIYIQNSLIFINFDKYTSNVSLFNEGGIYNNLKGFPYNNNNYNNIKNKYYSFIKKANDSFDGIFLVITFTDLEDDIKNNVFNIVNDIKEICKKIDPPIDIYFIDDDNYVYDIFKYIHLFYNEKNRKVLI